MFLAEKLNSSNKLLIDQVTRRKKFILQHGTAVAGTSSKHSSKVIPQWFDQAAFKHAQNLYETYSCIFKLSQVYGVIFGIHLYHALAPLLATGQSKNLSSIFSRYMSTNIHIRQWFTGGNPFDPSSASYRSLKVVRGLHLQVSSKLNQFLNDENIATADSEINQQNTANTLWMSQWDMMNTQFAFVGFIVLFPKKFGFNPSEYDLHCLLHFYRVIGHCLGIEDRFNLCDCGERKGNDVAEVTELCRQIYYNHWKPKIENSPEVVGQAMAEAIGTAFFHFAPFVTYRPLMHYVASTFGLANKDEFQLKTVFDYFFYALFSFLMFSISNSQLVMWFVSKELLVLEKFAFWFRHMHFWILDWWYSGEQKFQFDSGKDVRCPFTLTQINYKPAWEHRF